MISRNVLEEKDVKAVTLKAVSFIEVVWWDGGWLVEINASQGLLYM